MVSCRFWAPIGQAITLTWAGALTGSTPWRHVAQTRLWDCRAGVVNWLLLLGFGHDWFGIGHDCLAGVPWLTQHWVCGWLLALVLVVVEPLHVQRVFLLRFCRQAARQVSHACQGPLEPVPLSRTILPINQEHFFGTKHLSIQLFANKSQNNRDESGVDVASQGTSNFRR